MNARSKILAAALLFAGLVLVNYLASVVPVRLDATAERIYTLSPGTKALLARIDEPITLDFYFSSGTARLPITYKDYADRVREMLRQYVRASRGKITLETVDPEPDTPEEEKAQSAGLETQTLPDGGDQFYFGLVAIQADQQKTIPAFTPQREQFLEYDLSELLYKVQQTEKKKLGLLTSLPLQGSSGMPMLGQQPQDSQFVISEWQDTFDIVSVEPTATALPAGLDALAVIHPEDVSPKLQFAIDQFLLGGKPVFLAVDPSSQYFKHQGGEEAMFNGPPPNVSSDLPTLLGGWGLEYNPHEIVGDNERATQVQEQNGSVARYPVWLSLEHDDFNAKALPTAQLSSLLFVEAGSLALKPGVDLSFTPLVQTSSQAGDLDAASLQFAQPDDVASKILPSGKKTLAALVMGKFQTAFPDGPPDASAAAKPAAGSKTPAAKPAFLKASSGSSTLIAVADTDWLLDDFSVRKFNFLGQSAAEPLNDNLAFAANSLDFLSGSQALISIRGKGSSVRPFTVVQRMEAKANDKYREQLTGLEAQLSDVEAKLTELQGKKSEGGRLVATPEVAKSIEDFQKQEAALRGERREIRLKLREDIDSLGNRLLAFNLLLSPLLVCGFGFWFYRSRK